MGFTEKKTYFLPANQYHLHNERMHIFSLFPTSRPRRKITRGKTYQGIHVVRQNIWHRKSI